MGFSLSGNSNLGYVQGGLLNPRVCMYTNTTSETRRIVSVTVSVGTGSGWFHSPDSITGSGQPFPISVICSESAGNATSGAHSDTVTISKIGYAYGEGWAPSATTMLDYKVKFNFSTTVKVPAGQSRYFFLDVKSVASNCVVCVRTENTTGEDAPDVIRYNISFNPRQNNEGYFPSGQMDPYVRTVDAGSTANSVRPADPERPGYIFSYWNPAGDYTLTSPVNSDQYYYAKYVELAKGTIIYDANGGTPSPGSQTLIQGTPAKILGSDCKKQITITFNAQGGSVSPGSEKINLTLAGWYQEPNFSGKGYQPGSDVLSSWYTRTVNLYAKYNPGVLSRLPTPTKGTAKFLGWYFNTSGTGSKITTSTTFTDSITIYAVWLENLKYYPNGLKPQATSPDQSATYSVVEQERNESGTRLKTLFETFPDPQQQFLGWSTSSSGSPQYNEGDLYTESNPNIYAIWKNENVTITYDYKGGIDSEGKTSKKVTIPYGGSDTPPTVTKEGKTFAGWLGKYQNVTQDSKVIAMWESSPVWIWTGNNWIPYFAGVGLDLLNGG